LLDIHRHGADVVGALRAVAGEDRVADVLVQHDRAEDGGDAVRGRGHHEELADALVTGQLRVDLLGEWRHPSTLTRPSDAGRGGRPASPCWLRRALRDRREAPTAPTAA